MAKSLDRQHGGLGALQRCRERAKQAGKQIDTHGKMDGIFVPLYAQNQQKPDMDSNNLTLNLEVCSCWAVKFLHVLLNHIMMLTKVYHIANKRGNCPFQG